MPDRLVLAVALDGAGWHPAAWRETDAAPDRLLTAGYWLDLVGTAERGGVDLVTIEDALRLQSDDPFAPDARTDRVRGRLDAVLVAARVAPVTSRIGLVPTAVVTHTEPFHLSKSIATLDYASEGRAGIRVQVSGRVDEAAHVGRRSIEAIDRASYLDPENQRRIRELFGEARDYVEVLRRLWDSWEDDAEIRDAATGRFIDREKLHYIDFEGQHFSVRGPSITPRPPQGQPLVAALGHASIPYELIASSADLGFVTPTDETDVARIVGEIRGLDTRATPAKLLADLVVVLDDDETAARARLARLDERAGAPLTSDAAVFTGTPGQLAEQLLAWQAAGLDGFRLRPAALPHDLRQITDGLVPLLQRAGALSTTETSTTLRERLGLPRPANRYAAA